MMKEFFFLLLTSFALASVNSQHLVSSEATWSSSLVLFLPFWVYALQPSAFPASFPLLTLDELLQRFSHTSPIIESCCEFYILHFEFIILPSYFDAAIEAPMVAADVVHMEALHPQVVSSDSSPLTTSRVTNFQDLIEEIIHRPTTAGTHPSSLDIPLVTPRQTFEDLIQEFTRHSTIKNRRIENLDEEISFVHGTPVVIDVEEEEDVHDEYETKEVNDEAVAKVRKQRVQLLRLLLKVFALLALGLTGILFGLYLSFICIVVYVVVQDFLDEDSESDDHFRELLRQLQADNELRQMSSSIAMNNDQSTQTEAEIEPIVAECSSETDVSMAEYHLSHSHA